MHLVDVFGAGTTLGAFAVIISTVPMCLQLFRGKKVKNMPFLFYLVGNIRWVIYLHYGSLLDNQLILLMGSFGTFSFTTYIIMYTYYSKNLTKTASCLLLTWLFFMLFYHYLYNVWLTAAERHEGMGFLLVVLSFVVFSLPLNDVLQALQTSSVKCIHLVTVYPTGVWAISWCVYGVINNAPYVYGPTIPGILAFIASMYLVKKFKKDSKRHKGILVFYLNKKKEKEKEKKESISSMESSVLSRSTRLGAKKPKKKQ